MKLSTRRHGAITNPRIIAALTAAGCAAAAVLASGTAAARTGAASSTAGLDAALAPSSASAAAAAAPSLVMASGPASGSVAAMHSSAGPRGAAARFGALRAQPARLDRASRAALVHLGSTGPASPGRGFVVLDGSPGALAANPATGTVYVPIQCAASFCPSQNGHTVDVINAAKCNGKVRSDCRVVARARVGSSPLAAVVDRGTDTVYVTNGNDGTVSVLNGARCNAAVTSGCGHAVATVKVGKFPVAAAINPA